MTVSPEAIQAVAESLHNEGCLWLGHGSKQLSPTAICPHLLALRATAKRALEAAAPHVVAAERERLLLAVRHTCACESCKTAVAALLRDQPATPEPEESI